MARVTIHNDEPKGGETVTVQVNGFAPEMLSPGDSTTVFIGAENECVISVDET